MAGRGLGRPARGAPTRRLIRSWFPFPHQSAGLRPIRIEGLSRRQARPWADPEVYAQPHTMPRLDRGEPQPGHTGVGVQPQCNRREHQGTSNAGAIFYFRRKQGSYQNPVFGPSAPDPMALAAGRNDYYVYHTGSLFPILHSRDLVTWREAGTALASRPAWVAPSGDSHPWGPSCVYRPCPGKGWGLLLPLLRRASRRNAGTVDGTAWAWPCHRCPAARSATWAR